MIRLAFRLPTLLRASLLVLLVLGLVIKPVLTHIGELHGAEHALSSDADGHGHSHDDGQDDDEPGIDHTQGAHGLMHQGGMGGASSEMTAALAVPAIHAPRLVLPPVDVSPVSRQRLTNPFRPPIA